MKKIKREVYLNRIIDKKENGLVKVVTGIRRCGKSFLLDPLYKTYLLDTGVKENHIIKLDLDERKNNSFLNPDKLDEYVRGLIVDDDMYYLTSYIKYVQDAFLIEKAERYDIKGKKYIKTPYKFYFSDIGLRNCRLNFRQQEETHIMENIIYNELLYRGYNVDVGIVEIRDKNDKKQVEVDFVCNQFNKRYYIQSALSLPTREKTLQEEKSLMNIPDNFKKIIVVNNDKKPWFTEEGILVIGLKEFLLNKNSMDL